MFPHDRRRATLVQHPAIVDRYTDRMTDAPIPVLINRSGGTAASLGDRLRPAIEDAFAKAGVAIDLRLIDGAAMQAAVRDCVGTPIVVVGGDSGGGRGRWRGLGVGCGSRVGAPAGGCGQNRSMTYARVERRWRARVQRGAIQLAHKRERGAG